MNMILKKKVFKKGFLTLSSSGTFDKINGKLKFNKTNIQNVPILNHLIIFINTTPAIINPLLALPTLFRMGETNFDLQGYYIKNGYVDFNYDVIGNIVQINDMNTKGKMMDFKLKGKVNLETDKIKAKVDVVFMKDHSKFLNHIPLVGYIITGDDGNFVTQVGVTGTLSKPRFKTHTIESASKGAINMIKRIVTLPLLPFQDVNMTKEELKNHNKIVDELINHY